MCERLIHLGNRSVNLTAFVLVVMTVGGNYVKIDGDRSLWSRLVKKL